MREKFVVYALLALGCAAAAWAVMPRRDLYDVIANHPLRLVVTPPVSIVLLLALVALFFILPSALRRIDPGFRMDGIRAALMAVTLVCVGAVTELGYAFAVIPGIVAAVLLSQSLVGALLRVPFTFVMITLLVLGVRVPPSLVVMTPALFFTFIYFECVRYALIVRWYRHLCGENAAG